MDMTLLKSVSVVLLCGTGEASIHADDDPSLAKMQGQMEAAVEADGGFVEMGQTARVASGADRPPRCQGTHPRARRTFCPRGSTRSATHRLARVR
jgi:hypothetical protein